METAGALRPITEGLNTRLVVTRASETVENKRQSNEAAVGEVERTNISIVKMAESRNCRMYENELPEVEDVVMISVRRIEEMGAYVNLLEYNNHEGMILLSELSRRRIRSISKLIRVGKIMCVVVLRVDKEKGYIDLSKRRVTPDDIQKCEEKYQKSKAVHSIMRHVAEAHSLGVMDLYKQFGWDLYRRFGHAFDGFKVVLRDGISVLDKYAIDADVLETLLGDIARRLTPQPLKMRADVEVQCFNENGIDAIIACLSSAEAVSSAEDDMPVHVQLVAPPLYVFTTVSPDKVAGLALLAEGIKACVAEMEKYGGTVVVKEEPRVVSESEEKRLASVMDESARMNLEVSGDDDASDASVDSGGEVP